MIDQKILDDGFLFWHKAGKFIASGMSITTAPLYLFHWLRKMAKQNHLQRNWETREVILLNICPIALTILPGRHLKKTLDNAHQRVYVYMCCLFKNMKLLGGVDSQFLHSFPY